jgi:predicted acetyltransferase
MPLQVTLANSQDKQVIHRLLQLYLHEQCRFTHQTLREDGCFDFPSFDAHFGSDEKAAFLIRVRGMIAGFALVKERESIDDKIYNCITDFFIVETYRHFGIGEETARIIFDRFDGPWLVSARDENTVATSFWRQVIWRYTSNRFREYRKPGFDGIIFEFEAPSTQPDPAPSQGFLTRPIINRSKPSLI